MQTFSVRNKNRTTSGSLPLLEIWAQLHPLGPELQLLPQASQEEHWAAAANGSNYPVLDWEPRHCQSCLPAALPSVQKEFFQTKQLPIDSKGLYAITKHVITNIAHPLTHVECDSDDV